MLLSANNITKYNNDKCIFEDISFSIDENEKIALIGVNGTGKSTLLKIIAGIENYKGPAMIKKKGLRISYLAQEEDFKDTCTILEEVNKHVREKKELFEIRSILNKLGIENENEKIKILSGGMKKRVALAIALLDTCDLLLLDEPTNHLDNTMITFLENELIKRKQAVVMVTHDRYFLERITNTIYEIDHTHLYKTEGNYATYLVEKEERIEQFHLADKKRHAFLRKEIEWVRAGVQARTTKSKDRLAHFEELNNQKDYIDKGNVQMISVSKRLGKKTIEWEHLSKAYGNTVLFSDFSYNLNRNDRIGILGKNGCGKSTLLKILYGQIEADSGHIEYGETVKIGYFSQHHDELPENKRVIDFINSISNELDTDEGTMSSKVMLERFLFDASLQYKTIGALSGGEKRRLYLLSVLMQGANILFLDEPTNDLDIDTLTILEDYLDAFNGAIITVSHDRYFLDKVCDKLFVFDDHNINICMGTYADYIDVENKKSKDKGNGANLYKQQKLENKKVSLTYKEKQELASMESTIMSIEEKIELINQDMVTYSDDFKKLDVLNNERDLLEKELEEKNERYLYLLEKEEASKG